MILDVVFEELNQEIIADFGEVIYISAELTVYDGEVDYI